MFVTVCRRKVVWFARVGSESEDRIPARKQNSFGLSDLSWQALQAWSRSRKIPEQSMVSFRGCFFDARGGSDCACGLPVSHVYLLR